MFRSFSGPKLDGFLHSRYLSEAFLYADSDGSNESAVALDFGLKNTEKHKI